MTLVKSLLLLAALGLPAGMAAAQAPKAAPITLAQTLRANRWKKRLLLVGAPTAGQPELAQQKKLFSGAKAQLQARDLLVLQVCYDQLVPADRQYWTQQLQQPLTSFALVLIGKDGGVKRTSTQPVPAADLFGTIDQMPMRQQEMRSPKK